MTNTKNIVKLILNIVFTLGITLVLTSLININNVSELQPGAKAQIFILLDFDGDPNFPSITWQHQTRGLDPFIGTALGLPTSELENLKERITDIVKADYSEFRNVHIVTSKDDIDQIRIITSADEAELSFWYTWGIDDDTYVFSFDEDMNDDDEPNYTSPISRNQACPETGRHGCGRLYGKVGAYPDPFEKDQFDGSIYNPLFARTFAGSFSVPSGGPSPSNPALIYGDSYPQMGLANISVEHLAQAIANSASHEIAHLFRLAHLPLGCGAACVNDLMHTKAELWMARNNMEFVYPDGLEQLRNTLTTAATADLLEPNNSIATPSLIDNQQLDLTLHNPFDEDYIKYVAPPTTDQPIKITITHDFPIEDRGLRRLLSVDVWKMVIIFQRM